MFNDEADSLLGSLSGSLGFESEDTGLFPALTLPQRLFGCSLCLVVGWILSFGAFQRIILLIQGNILVFRAYMLK